MSEYKTIIDQQEKLLQILTNPMMTVTQKTLRDEFAMAALTGVIRKKINIPCKEIAADAYAIADAMMEARK